MARFTDSFRNYHPAACCGNCDHGYDRLCHDRLRRHCSLHVGAEVVRGYVCDDWEQIDAPQEDL
jgi:hypothetical protein